MARDKLITIRIEGEKRDAFNQLAKAQNTDTASLLYDFINQCLDGRIDIKLVTGKKQWIDKIDNQLDTNRLDKLEATTQRIDNRLDTIAKKLADYVEAFDDRLNDCDQGLSNKITSLEHRLNALASQLDSKEDSQKDRQEIDTDSQEIDDMEPLLKLQREASIADHSPDEPAIEDLTDQSSSPAKRKGLTDSELARHLGIDKSNITRWKQKGEPTQKYRDKWELRGRFWHEKD
jgi:chromosome segregation ATPase